MKKHHACCIDLKDIEEHDDVVEKQSFIYFVRRRIASQLSSNVLDLSQICIKFLCIATLSIVVVSDCEQKKIVVV